MTRARPLAFAVRGLAKRFGLETAVRDVSFVVPAGTIAALIGPAGAGKTTIVRMLLGLLEPTSGTAAVGGPGSGVGRTTGTRSPGQVVGAMLDVPGAHPARSVRAHLRVYAAAVGVSDARVDEMLALVRLDEIAEAKTRTLSEGMQTRLALATALLGDPPLLVLDDPAAGFDARERAWLDEFLRGHARRGGTALVTSRSLAAVLPVADSLIVLNHGSIVYQGSPARLRRSHPDRQVVTVSSPIALATALAAHGFTDAVMRPDGRLAIAEASRVQIEEAATAARVQLTEILADPVHPDQVLTALTTPSATAHHPVPTSYGMPR